MAGDYSDIECFPPHWPMLRIGDIAAVKGGKRLPAGTALVQSRTSHPYVRIVDFKDGRIDKTALLYVPDEVFPRIARYTISSNDIYVSIVGTIGLVGVVDEELDGANLTENAAKVCNIADHVDRDYLAAFLRSGWGQHQINALTVGSTQPKLALFRIKDIRVPLPLLCEQRAIAHILGTLDDKIELNRRIDATLEGIARALFKSWFVDFDPVHAKAEGREPVGMDAEIAALFPDSFEESQLGLIPSGWRAMPLDQSLQINPPRKLPKGAPAPYLEMARMPTSSARGVGAYVRPFGSGSRFVNGDTLVARITPCLENGKTCLVDFLETNEIGWGSTEYIVLRPRQPLPTEYAYLLARTEGFRSFAIANMTGTSGRQRVPSSVLSSYLSPVPGEAVARAFGRLVAPLFAGMKAHDEESKTLTDLRDALLPKLISGELRVPDVEKIVAENPV